MVLDNLTGSPTGKAYHCGWHTRTQGRYTMMIGNFLVVFNNGFCVLYIPFGLETATHYIPMSGNGRGQLHKA
jgi:hypothetical protein